MGVIIDGMNLKFESVIYEDDVTTMRDFFQNSAPECVSVDMSECDDIHLAVLQTIMAYKKLYDCAYVFGDEVKIYQKVLEGFDSSENHCN
jgi:predicted enzyme involved in methoxymalonyl-ACP biosynthesis